MTFKKEIFFKITYLKVLLRNNRNYDISIFIENLIIDLKKNIILGEIGARDKYKEFEIQKRFMYILFKIRIKWYIDTYKSIKNNNEKILIKLQDIYENYNINSNDVIINSKIDDLWIDEIINR